MQLPLQRLAIPFRQLRRSCVGSLQKSEQELVGGLPDARTAS